MIILVEWCTINNPNAESFLHAHVKREDEKIVWIISSLSINFLSAQVNAPLLREESKTGGNTGMIKKIF